MTIVVTNATGGTARPMTALYVPPDRQTAQGATALGETGLNAAFVADLLSACLAHERCGERGRVSGDASPPGCRARLAAPAGDLMLVWRGG